MPLFAPHFTSLGPIPIFHAWRSPWSSSYSRPLPREIPVPVAEVVHVVNRAFRIATQTFGFFESVELPTPSQEANLRRRELQEFYQLDATVVVEQTQFWHLPEPDRRRINEKTNNFANYGQGIWLVDQDGIIVEMSDPSRATDVVFRR